MAQEEEEEKKPVFWKNFVAGTAAGIVQVLVGQPFDTIKVRLQSQGETKLYSGAADCVRQTVTKEGPLAFYKGTVAPLVGIGFCVAIQFAVMEQMKGYYNRKDNGLYKMGWADYFMSGGVAGIANSIVSCPVEHVRTRLQVQNTASGATPLYRGTLDAVRKIYKTHGLTGLYKGQVITMWREYFGYGLYFLAYEFSVHQMAKRQNVKKTQLGPQHVMTAGAIGGIAMWIPCFPIDVVKSKIQTDGFASEGKYKSIVHCIRSVFQREGIAGFYRGFTPCLLRAAPVNASTFLAFEYAMRILGRD